MQQTLSHFSLLEIQKLIEAHKVLLLILYSALLSVRGVLFVPTIPFIILMAGTLDGTLAFVVTLAASTTSAYLVCVAVDTFNFAAKLEKIPAKSLKRATQALQSYGFYAVVGWAFFPFVFTEFIVYLARIGGLSRRRIVTAVAIGEGALIYMIIETTEYFKSLLL
ncbi:hypothetical protein [Reinekea marinisedimentorum]|uniref:Membrane protein YqaA with SNARE-associated domain n=1 Tax=Reinekea marinisedimentorum TaxID=230495 RepID=A0A4R3IDS6_9GAMM|nr:hypothetical protein [Reinekea marinisedimentorum]TCS43897.1 hypothetical protein BCF53_101240 [Reinekea marinisedimentorum]